MKTITLTDEQYNQLIDELIDGECQRRNDDHTHTDNVPSKIRSIIEHQIETEPTPQ